MIVISSSHVIRRASVDTVCILIRKTAWLHLGSLLTKVAVELSVDAPRSANDGSRCRIDRVDA